MDYRRNKSEVYLHLVWATSARQPLLTPEIEHAVHRCIEHEARKLGCDVLAIDGMPDHVHMAVKLPTKLSIALLMKQAKGISSALANDLGNHEVLFRWQEGYGVLSVSRSHLPKVIAYIENQKRHHAAGKVWSEWEQTEESLPSPNDAGKFFCWVSRPEDARPKAPKPGTFCTRPRNKEETFKEE